MSYLKSNVFKVGAALLLLPFQFNVAAQIKIVCVGDSIVASVSQVSQPGQYGWGETLGTFLDDDVEVVNRASGGRSSKSYIDEGRWEKAKKEHADYYLIEFGHNDQKSAPSKYTDPDSSFRDYLKVYIREAKEIGAIPILVAPFVRRYYSPENRIRESLAPYAIAMGIVAEEESILFIDTYTASRDHFNLIGEQESLIYSDTEHDRTHFSLMGANWCSRLITDAIKQSSHPSVIELQKHIIRDSQENQK